MSGRDRPPARNRPAKREALGARTARNRVRMAGDERTAATGHQDTADGIGAGIGA